MLRTQLPLLLLLLLLLASPAALAQTIAGWDFEDGDLTIDVTSDGNTANVVSSTGEHKGFVSGDGSANAASFDGLHTADTSFLEISVDAAAIAGSVTLSFSANSSNTASKWWRADLSVDGGASFTPLSPLLEVTGSPWKRPSWQLPGAAGASDVRVRLVATDSAGDGSGDFVQADGSGLPGSTGTFRIDDVFVQREGLDAGPDPIVDAGPLPPAPIITEVAWMGSLSSANDEWVELYNPGPADIADLSAYSLVEGSGPVSLPAVPLLAGETVVLERSAATTSLGSPEAELATGFVLTNGGEALRVCPASDIVDLEGCDVASLAGQSWAAGDNTSKRTMVRRRAELDGSLPSSWATYEGDPSAVTDSGGLGIVGSPGSYEPMADLPDAGPGDAGLPPTDAGFEPVDAGPNAPPTLTLKEPSGEVNASGEVTVRYVAADPDGDDTASVSLFYDIDDVGLDGVRFARGLPAGEGAFSWSTGGVPPGSYRVFGLAEDVRGEKAFSYAAGTVIVPSPGPNGGASIALLDPDGVNDVTPRGIPIRWDVELPEGQSGVVSLWYDDDDDGLDGTPIIAGLPVTDEEGEPGPRSFLWEPADVPSGTYAIYAVLDWTGGTVSDYSEFFTVEAVGCDCRTAVGGEGEQIAYGLALAALLVVARRRPAKRHPRRRP